MFHSPLVVARTYHVSLHSYGYTLDDCFMRHPWLHTALLFRSERRVARAKFVSFYVHGCAHIFCLILELWLHAMPLFRTCLMIVL